MVGPPNKPILKKGDRVTDFRGNTGEVLHVHESFIPGKSHKVTVKYDHGTTRTYYEEVFK